MRERYLLPLSLLCVTLWSACIDPPSFFRSEDDGGEDETSAMMQTPPGAPDDGALDMHLGDMNQGDMSQGGMNAPDQSAPDDMGEPNTPDLPTTCPGTTCAPNTFQCQGPKLYACVEDAKGCASFEEVERCAEDQFCDEIAGECACNADDGCSQGERRCNVQDAEVCVVSAAGCAVWVVEESCMGRKRCNAATNRCQCATSECAGEGDTSCLGTNTVTQCKRDADGCLYADTQQGTTSCGPGGFCEDGACQTCAIQCAKGAVVCNPDGTVKRCVQTSGDRCPKWSSPLGCAATHTNGCTTGACGDESQCQVCPGSASCDYCPLD